MFEPIENKVLLKVKEEPKVSAGGIVLPDKAASDTVKAIVFAVGPECKQVEHGNVVLLNPSFATEIVHDGDSYLLTTEPSLMAIVE